MEIVALFVGAFLQLATLLFGQLRETIDGVATALAAATQRSFQAESKDGHLLVWPASGLTS